MMKGRKRKSGLLAAQVLDPASIEKIALWLEGAGVASIEIETEDGRLVRIVTGEDAASPEAGREPASSVATKLPIGRPAKAPIAGHFLPVHPGRDAAEAAIGASVFPEQIVGFVGIGPLIMPIRAEEAGTLRACTVGPGDLVGYGDTVFLIEPAQ
jgi:biotin carboxyl carrier protein